MKASTPLRPRSVGRMFTAFLVLAFLVLGLGLSGTYRAYADSLYASIRGEVTDPSGAVLPGVSLMATNVATGLSYTVVSDKDGNYSFLQLPIGDYSLSARKRGFKVYQEKGVHLNLNQVLALNISLQLGVVSQSVTVEANQAQIQTTDMQLGTTVSGRQIVDLPLNGRNWTQLQQLEPGVVASSDRFLTYSTNGSETQQNSYLINGTDSNDISLNTPLVIPSPDAIGEFRMVTSTINPEYGRNSGAIINAAIKSGTNQFHGDAFEFYRDTFLDAKSWFEQQASPFHQNEFGGTLGGPIVKDHAFFFFSYQGLREKVPQAFSVPTVYTSAERTGDFSADTGGAPFSSGNVSPFPMVDSNGVTQPAGTPYSSLFPTGVIPTADLNPLAVKLMSQFVPAANAPGNTYEFNPITTETSNQYIYRLDDQLRRNDALWLYGLYQTTPSQDTLPFFGATVPGFAENAKRHYQEYTVAWNHTFSPTTLNEARFAYLRFNFVAVNPVNPIDPTSYGFTGITPQVPSIASLPVMNVSGFFSLGFSSDGPQPRIQNTYQFTDNFSKVWGHHTFKAGFSMERLEINNPFYSNLSGTFSYNGAGVFTTGNPGADFLLGIPDSYAQGSGSITRGRGREYYSYVQDQWQVRPSLTLTLGTGWDIETPWRNLYANGEVMGAWRPGEQSKVIPTAPVGFVYPGDPGINKYGGPTVHYRDFAPRFGFAWSPGVEHNWSIRGGIGLYYNRSEEELILQNLAEPPFSLSSGGATAISSPAFATPFSSVNPSAVGSTPAGTISNPFPFTPPAPGAAVDFTPYEPIGFDFNSQTPNFTSARVTNFNLTIERQLSPSTVVSLGYVGSIGRHEEGAYNGNMAGQAPGVNPAAAAYNGGTCTTGLLLQLASVCPQAGMPGGTPYPLAVYGQPGIQASAYNSNYNSLQAQFTRRLSKGLQVNAAYTWSRYFDETSNLESNAFNFPGINPFDVRSMYGPSASDAPQRFVVSYSYTLPFYSLTHRWRRLTGGWRLLGIYTLQHGFPVPVFNLLSTSLTCDVNGYSFYVCPDRANRTGTPLSIGNPRNYTIGGLPNYWFNPAAFSIPDPGTGIGNANRNPLYGPGINYTDMAIEKDVHFTESKYLELRLETFNTFNHANFANPATPGFSSEDASPIDASTFGRIFGVQTLTTNGDGRVVQLGAKVYF
jgi:hypothetical protein